MYIPVGTVGILSRTSKVKPEFKAGDMVVVIGNSYRLRIVKLDDAIATTHSYKAAAIANLNVSKLRGPFVPLKRSITEYVQDYLLDPNVKYPLVKRRAVRAILKYKFPITKKLATGRFPYNNKDCVSGVFFLPYIVSCNLYDMKGFTQELYPITLAKRLSTPDYMTRVFSHLYDYNELLKARTLKEEQDKRDEMQLSGYNTPAGSINTVMPMAFTTTQAAWNGLRIRAR